MRLVQALLVCLFFVLIFNKSEQNRVNSGPYDIEVDRVYLCEDQGNGKAKFNISMYLGKDPGPKYKKHLHRGSLSFPFESDEVDRMTIIAKFYQKKTNDYLLMYTHKGEFCSTVEEIASVSFKSFRKEIGLPEEGCVIPRGDYTFTDWLVVFGVPTPMLEYGTYKAIFTFLNDEEEVYGCITILLDVKRKF